MYVVVVTCCIEMLSNSSLQLHLGSARTRKDKGSMPTRDTRLCPRFSNRPDISLTLPIIKLVDFSNELTRFQKREKIQNIHPLFKNSERSIISKDTRSQFSQKKKECSCYEMKKKAVLNFFLSNGLRFNRESEEHLRNGVRIVATCATLANPKD